MRLRGADLVIGANTVTAGQESSEIHRSKLLATIPGVSSEMPWHLHGWHGYRPVLMRGSVWICRWSATGRQATHHAGFAEERDELPVWPFNQICSSAMLENLFSFPFSFFFSHIFFSLLL